MDQQTKIDFNQYQQLFSNLGDTIWLNHAGVSPVSSAVAEGMRSHLEDVLTSGAAHTPEWYHELMNIRRLASGLLGGSAKDIAVTPNTTYGVNLIASGLDWKEGDEIVLSSKEYPANVYPWWAQQERGAKLVWVEEDENHRLPVEAYEAKITDRTKVLTVSHVQFATGFRHDLKRLGDICRERGILFFVDAIQSFSVFDIRVEEWGIDALTTGSHKWLLGPTGIALFYTTPELRDHLTTTFVGADSMVDSLDYLNYNFQLLPDARRFENAMLNFHGAAGLQSALEVVARFGRENIETKIKQNSERIRSNLLDLGFEDHSVRGEEEWSGILTLIPPGGDPTGCYEALKRRDLYTSVRDGRLRVSPHAYHPEESFEKINQIFKAALKEI
ncbi:MAG: aminotransferase class V-fold PLP-dependent enzyme [Candidatus Omnitrophica bacterium]|nr:aminotransferase class V-fold PLP-dependent enzyme [Candidatus Omnitrophota bacterium]